MLRALLICGLVAGACGGLLAAGFASVAGVPAVDRAIVFEHASAHDHADAAPAPVSRGVQKSAGLLTASLVYGLALGGMFALAFAVAYGRVAAKAGPRLTAYCLAAAGFVVVYLVPFLKYPASPPGATDADSIGRRTALYATMVAISVLSAVAASRLRPALERRWGGHSASLAAALAFVVVVVAAALALPAIDETPSDFPATTLWSFREASLGMQAVLWTTIGLAFAPLAQRVLDGRPLLARPERSRPAAATD